MLLVRPDREGVEQAGKRQLLALEQDDPAGGPAGLPLCRWHRLAGNRLLRVSSIPFAVSPQLAA